MNAVVDRSPDSPADDLAQGFARHVELWARRLMRDDATVQLVRQAAFEVSRATSEGHVCLSLADLAAASAPAHDVDSLRGGLLASAAPAPYAQTRAKTYFERTLQLFNLHDVEPVLVIMPYHPTALAAFRAAGWDAKEEAFKAYLESLRGRYRFHILDYTDIASFHGDAGAFYDGAHVTAVNARRILAQAVEDVPQAFR